jgi:hypothetical protein
VRAKRPSSSLTSERREQALLLLAGLGTVLVFLDLGLVSNLVGLVAAVAAATAIGLTARVGPARRWWPMLGAGAAILLAGFLLSLLADTPGGVLIVVGGTLLVVAAALGFPERSRG